MTNKPELFHFFNFSALLEFLLNLALMPFFSTSLPLILRKKSNFLDAVREKVI